MTLINFSINFCLLWWQSSLCISEVNVIQNSSLIKDVDKFLHLPQIGKSSEKNKQKNDEYQNPQEEKKCNV